MSTAVADPIPSPSPVELPAIVVANAPHPEIAGSQLARVLRPAFGAVAVRSLDDAIAERAQAVVLAAHADLAAGLAALRRIRKESPATRVVLVAADEGAAVARQAMNAGADAFVPAADAAHALAPALAAVRADLVCVPRVARRVIAKPAFSHREKEVLGLLVEGMTNRQIAARLYLAESTVKTHVASAFAKLGVRSRKEAATVLLDPAEGLVTTALPPETALP
jgi:DNA-binding NarL/FixJ family response regulator